MVNSLLSPSSVFLYGQRVTDIKIQPFIPANKIIETLVSVSKNHTLNAVLNKADGVTLEEGDTVLLMLQSTLAQNGRYTLSSDKKPIDRTYAEDEFYKIVKGEERGGRFFQGTNAVPDAFSESEPNVSLTDNGKNKHLLEQLTEAKDPGFARIYGFSFEGLYFDMSRPTNFLVAGPGRPVTDLEFEGVLARAPRDPEQTGFGAADFQVAGRMSVWVYDRADFTIRMDLDGGRFEDILLGFEIGDDSDPDGGGSVGGGRVGGGRVGGGRVGGGRVGGGRVGGGRVGGGRVGGGRVGGGRVGGG